MSTLPNFMRQVSFRQLQVFESVARNGSFTAAANELYLTQPTVSTQIKKLEEAIDNPLFEQVGRKIYLTETGQQLLGTCRNIFSNLNDFQTQRTLQAGLKGAELKISAVTTTEYFTPLLISSFYKRYPKVKFALRIVDREELVYRMKKNKDDLYLIDQLPRSLELVSTPFLDNPLVVVAPAEHPLANTGSIPIETLASEHFILRETGSGTRIALNNFLEKKGINLKTNLELSSNEAIKQAVIGGLGLSVLSCYAVSNECQRNDLTTLEVEGFPLREQWYVAYPKNKELSALASTYLDFLLKEGRFIVMRSLSKQLQPPPPVPA